MKWIKKLFCKHDYIFVEKHSVLQENLYKCSKCNQHFVLHFGCGVGSKFSKEELSKFWK